MGYLFWIWGSLMHVAILWGVLDVNFHSPVLKGLPPIQLPSAPPAKRLVLFVADGLRFRTFIEDPPPYLIRIMTERGTWGVSRTRMPTESRPGHVALAAGLYEDPSALFKGWKENPVDFDSVFNRSHQTWAWGSPDIIPMFVKGSGDKVQGKSYPANWQDFDGNSEGIIRLDSWVFKEVYQWLTDNEPETKYLDRIILFLHLLGCDTAGHANKPYSREYRGCVTYVDREIERLVRTVEEHYGDNRTAYVFTSDHGMTDWGSHGSGSLDETETPLVVWGSGVNSLKKQVDVEQADIAPLISSLLGIPIPVNNEGVLPMKYLRDENAAYTAGALIANLKQLKHQVRGNRVLSHGSDSEPHLRETSLSQGIHRAEYLLTAGKTMEAINEGKGLMSLAKESLVYFREYHRGRLMFYLTISWLGWIMLLFLKITNISLDENRPKLVLLWDVLFVCTSILLFIVHRVSGTSGWRLQGYALLALLSSWLATRSFSANPCPSFRGGWYWIGCTISLTSIMSFGLTMRWIFGAATLCMCVIQGVLFKDADRFLPWTTIVLAAFPLLPTVGPDTQTHLVLLALVIGGMTVITADDRHMNISLKAVEGVRLTTTALISSGLVDGRSLLSWLILISTPLCICAYPVEVKGRIFGVSLAFLPTLALLSVSYEPLFLIALTGHLLCWPMTTDKRCKMWGFKKKETISVKDFLVAGFFVSFYLLYEMLYVLLGFFGTGNIASISSFDPTWTRHFLTVFSPFTMCTLIVLKTSIPLLVVGCGIRTLAPSNLFMTTILLADCLTLQVMHTVTPRGSWMDIGSAISRFVIAMTLPCLMLLLYHISRLLVTYSVWKIDHSQIKQHV
ncbi:GPI ethanolamine phosphate transferase 1 isoform X1 [Neodiprion pinetum]|uniref:GPI ethanolamine phosphate transferase 1 isoform X1 n=1 Tax=Neodiprion pinetum TaxID=441929 RepID=UPI001EDEFB16|nr:GPI ethanolamine phosphate transferase 1 isoform X1 [Neodiprion pinetum]